MATLHEIDLMNNVEISPGFCLLCGDPWEACLCKSADDFPEFGDFCDEDGDDDLDYQEDES